MTNQPYNVVTNRAAEYLRYSSDNQTEATISAQHRIVQAFADAEGYNIIKSYVDEAETATTSYNRDAFLDMLSDAKKGLFDYVIVWQFSRFARNKEESVIYKAMLRKIGVRVISATEKTDDTPSGKLLEGVLEVLNQYFSDNLSVEVKKGKKENVITGKHAGGKLPFGIYKDEETDLFKIDEEKAKTVRTIFDLYVHGYGVRRISSILHERGLMPLKAKQWCQTTIKAILKNEAYIGVYNYTLGKGTQAEETFKIDNIYPQIIDSKTWALAKKISLQKSKPKRSKRNRLYILTGKTTCGCCGRNYIGTSAASVRQGEKTMYYYYRCKGRDSTGKHAGRCINKDVNAEKLEAWVLEQIKEHILSDKAIETILDTVTKKIKAKSKTSNKDIKKLEKEAAEIDEKLDRFLDLYGDGKISKARLNEKTENLEKALANVRLELNQLKALNGDEVDLKAIKTFLLKNREKITDTNPEVKKTLIDTFVDKIIVEPDKITLTIKVDESLDNSVNISDSNVDMYHIAVANTTIYKQDITEILDKIIQKRYSIYDPNYHLYSDVNRQRRLAQKERRKNAQTPHTDI